MDLYKYFRKEEEISRFKANPNITLGQRIHMIQMERSVLKIRIAISMLDEFEQKFIIAMFKLKMSIGEIEKAFYISRRKVYSLKKEILEKVQVYV